MFTKYLKKIVGTKSKAQGMVEFALVIPILLTLLFGIFEAGRMFWIYSAVTTASREAARLGSSVSDNGSGTPNYIDCSAIRDAAKRIGDPGKVVDADISISYDDGPTGTNLGSCPLSAGAIQLGDRIVVTVIGHFSPAPAIPLFSFPTFDITSVSRRTIIKEVIIATAASGSTSTAGASTSTSTPAVTATNTPAITATNTPPVATNTPSVTPSTPEAPVYDSVEYKKSGNKCKDIELEWGPNSIWPTYPGSSPANYQVFINGSSAGTLAAGDPGTTEWDTSVDLNNNASVTFSVIALFSGPLGSDQLSVSFHCNKGNLVLQ
jgi:hypothetical protein